MGSDAPIRAAHRALISRRFTPGAVGANVTRARGRKKANRMRSVLLVDVT
jgi:hypothetical protein